MTARLLPMLSLSERVYRTILRYQLLPPGARIIVAASGGADSTALLHVLLELATPARFAVTGVAHFNHCLRKDASEADERFCRKTAAGLGLPFEGGRADVLSEARRMRTSVEDAARRLRYLFLAEAAGRQQATHIAVGHTRDDQAETVLLALVRGAGPRGLGGMRRTRGAIIRPLLDESHEDLVAWLTARGLTYREDESNQDRRYARNRVRHELLPLLRERFSAGIVRVLVREAAIAADDAELLEALGEEALGQVAAGIAEGLVIDAAALLSRPAATARRTARLALERVAGGRFIGLDQADRLLGLAAGRLRTPVAFPGVRAEKQGDRLVLRPVTGGRPEAPASATVNFFGVSLSIPGEVHFPGTGLVVSSELRPWSRTALGEQPKVSRDPLVATVDAATVGELVVRGRRPGDWFRPLGLGGRKKLQDFFVDRKVPRADRDRTPLVAQRDGRIVWVAGHGIAEDFRVSPGTHDVVILKLRGERV